MHTLQLFEPLCCICVIIPSIWEHLQVDALEKGKRKGKGKHPNQKGTRTRNTDINTCKNFGRTGHWVKDCWRPGEGAYDNSNNTNKGKGKGKQLDVVQTTLSCETASTLPYPSWNPSTMEALWSNPDTQEKRMHQDLGRSDTQVAGFNKETCCCSVFAS